MFPISPSPPNRCSTAAPMSCAPPWIPDKLYIFLRAISQGKEVESTLINRQGQYQVVDPGRSHLPGSSDYIPPVTAASGVEEIQAR